MMNNNHEIEIPPRLKRVFYDKKRKTAFRVSALRKYPMGVVVDMESKDGKTQQFSYEFFQTLISRGEFTVVHQDKLAHA